MDDSEQALQDDTGITRASTAFEVDRSVTSPWIGDEGGQTPSSEYFLHFKVALVPQRWAGTGHRRCLAGSLFGHWCGRSPPPTFPASLL